jgi:23S rRNA (pseudouridine1915-N3)-methyltransferase
MRLTLVSIATRRRSRLFEAELREYVGRLAHWAAVEEAVHPTEAALWAALDRQRAPARKTVLLDSRGGPLSSEQFAAWLGRQREGGAQHLVFATGPADGWTRAARERADLLLSFGPMTFPHELARVMLAEQIYRAFTILAGHPYHGGH